MDKKAYIAAVCRIIEIRMDSSFLQSTLTGDFGGGTITDPDSDPAL